ncbi:MAG: sulfatase-like hydrolase/transferase [Verrucomicrobiae bacterium]|nr:sulfatase-like hydrolase/transferase [Verrucomicrobiae bacterium]
MVALSGHGADPPNIVYIISDDQTWTDYGFMGNERVHTPNLDRLAAQSARFPNAYLTTSVCRPSLVTLMTGLYPHQHLVHFNHGPPGNAGFNRIPTAKEYVEARSGEFDLIRRIPTLPRLLTGAGYRCLQTGKFWEGHWSNGGFTEGMTTFTGPPESQTYGGGRKLSSGEIVAHGNGDHGLAIGRETMEPIEIFVRDCEAKNIPWFVWYAPFLPHQPHDSPDRFYEMAKTRPGIKPHELPYYAAIAQFDDTVGRLVEFVERNSDPAGTLFVFVADNGWSPSKTPEKSRPAEYAHTRTSKRAPFDEGLRSPILIRWDGKVTPADHPELVSSIDLVPTLLKAAGLPASARQEMPGSDLLGDLNPERAVFGEIYPGDASVLGHPERDIAYRWVRQGDYKLIVPHGEKPWGGYLEGEGLFKVQSDPGEKVNLIREEGMDKVADGLRALLDQWWKP